jgi:hypothetical protein
MHPPGAALRPAPEGDTSQIPEHERDARVYGPRPDQASA